jgi:putative membrane-bound dehydrogenase-like protein
MSCVALGVPAERRVAAATTSSATRPATRDLAAELPRVPPPTPEEARRRLHVLPGFRVELVAAEPLVFSPVAIDFDENGRAYVCEMIDYPFASPEPLGSIAVLKDTNGDGTLDQRTVLADKIPWPTAVLCYDGGCFVGTAPDILYLKDTTGDGKADIRKTVFTGFGKQNVQGLLNSFRWGIDNRIHGATGTNGGTVRRADLPADDPKNKPVNLAGRDFSFDARLLDLRPESGGAQHGMCFDDFGRKFVSSNSDHIQQVVYDDRYASKASVIPLPPARVSIAADGPQAKVFRRSPVEPWRIIRTKMRVSGEVKGIVEGGGQPAGYFTGATGITIYRGDAFPPEYKGQAFIGDVGSNLVHRKVIKPVEGSVVLRAERVDEGREFLASEDVWFRPAQFANAPDGTLWVLDVCREVIEHPASIPDSIKQHLDLTSGKDRGRIWRVVPEGYKNRPAPKLAGAKTAELVKLLEHPNAWHREVASRLLYERGDKSASIALVELATRSNIPVAKIHALYALVSGGGILDHSLSSAAIDKHKEVRRHAFIMASIDALKEGCQIQSTIEINASKETDLANRLQLALTIGFVTSPTGGYGVWPADDLQLGNLCSIAADPYVTAAALRGLSSDLTRALNFFGEDRILLQSQHEQKALQQIARLAGLRRSESNIDQVLAALEKVPPEQGSAAEAIISGLTEGLVGADVKLRAKIDTPKVSAIRERLLAAALAILKDSKSSPMDRVSAVRSLGSHPLTRTRAVLAELLGGATAADVQLAAVAALDSHADPEVGTLLVAASPKLTPAVRPAVQQALLSRPNRAAALLSAMDAGKIPVNQIDPAALARLQTSKDPAVRKLADAVAAKAKLSPRADVIAAFRKALDTPGDADKGKAIFTQRCAACHRLDNDGSELGPNLASMRSRGAEAVLINVLDPNREVNGQFVEYQVETKDGQNLAGLLSSEGAASITLLRAGGQSVTIARDQIESLKSTGHSLMPEGLERDLDVQAMADLIAYVMKER